MRIIHTHSYLRSIKKLFSEHEQDEVDEIVSINPLVGDVIPGTHGVRKFRVALGGRGKRGGARVIYYFWKQGESVYLILAYPKNQQEDLSPDEKKSISQLARMIERGEYEH